LKLGVGRPAIFAYDDIVFLRRLVFRIAHDFGNDIFDRSKRGLEPFGGGAFLAYFHFILLAVDHLRKMDGGFIFSA